MIEQVEKMKKAGYKFVDELCALLHGNTTSDDAPASDDASVEFPDRATIKKATSDELNSFAEMIDIDLKAINPAKLRAMLMAVHDIIEGRKVKSDLIDALLSGTGLSVKGTVAAKTEALRAYFETEDDEDEDESEDEESEDEESEEESDDEESDEDEESEDEEDDEAEDDEDESDEDDEDEDESDEDESEDDESEDDDSDEDEESDEDEDESDEDEDESDEDEDEDEDEEAEEESEEESEIDPAEIAKSAPLPKEAVMKKHLNAYNKVSDAPIKFADRTMKSAYRKLLAKLVTADGEVAKWGTAYVDPEGEICSCGIPLEEHKIKGSRREYGKCLVTGKIYYEAKGKLVEHTA